LRFSTSRPSETRSQKWRLIILIAIILICLPVLPINPIKLVYHAPKPSVPNATPGKVVNTAEIASPRLKDKEAVSFLRQKAKQRAEMDLGAKYMQDKHYEGAMKAFSYAVLLDPESALAHQQLGLAAALSNNYAMAIKEFELAIKLKPDDAIAHNNLALAYEHIGKIDAAKREFDTAVKLAPHLAQAHYGLGVVLSRKGEFNAAAKEFEQAQVLDWKIPDGYRRAQECMKKATHPIPIRTTYGIR
jgi:tetratricopeptide (TPR) repeat protein